MLLGATYVALGGLLASPCKLDQREDLPVEAFLHRDLVRQVVAAERVHDLPAALDLTGLEERHAEDPAGPAAARRHRVAGQSPADPRALLGGRDRGFEVTGVVLRKRQLAQRPREVVRAGRQPRRLDGRLAELDRVGHAPLHLEGVALDEPDRDQQPALAGGPGDRDAAVRVRGGVVVVLEVVLRPAEVVQRLQPGRQLGVRQPVDEAARFLTVLARRGDLSRGRLAERQRRRGRGDQDAVAGRTRRRQRPAAHRYRLLEVELVEAVHRQLELQRRRRRGRAIGQLVPGARQTPMGLLVSTEPVLDRRAARSQLHPARDRVGGKQRQRIQQRLPATLELTE